MFYAVSPRVSRSFQRPQAPVANSALERFLTDTYTSLGADTGSARSATIEDQEKTYSLQFDVPGIAKEQLDIGIEGDVVRVSSKAEATRSVKAAWRFPLEIDAANSSAKLENGVLSLTLGKKFPVSNVAALAIS